MSDSKAGRYGVAVGVDGSDQGCMAVRYAAVEAERLRLPLDVVHVLPADVPVVTSRLSVPEASLQRHGADILAQAHQVASQVSPTLEVRTHLRSGGRTRELLAVAERAELLVIGSRSPRTFDHVWTGGTVTGVASSASCPLVVVPADCQLSVTHDRIVVGVKIPGQARDLLEVGLRMAAERRAELVVVHAWRIEGVYDDIIADRTRAEQWEAEQSKLIEQELGGLRQAFPGVEAHVFVRHEDPAHALVRVSCGADRLLIQRPPTGRWMHHLGRVARAVLRDARCPVFVLPELRVAPPSISHDHAETLVS